MKKTKLLINKIKNNIFICLSFIFLIYFLFNVNLSQSAPYPTTSTSLLQDMETKNILDFKELGFSLNNNESIWEQKKIDNKEKASSLITYFEENNSNKTKEKPATLSVRVRKIEKSDENANFQNYVKKWVTTYPKFGFNILGSRFFKQNNNQGFVVDMIHKKKNKQLRQVIFLKNNLAVVMTCTDKQNFFKKTLTSCNKIIRSFKWKN